MTDKKKVKNILFEKVLFQKLEDYKHVEIRLKELGIHAWVNCARRQMDSYQDLRKELDLAHEMRIHISGGEWGLACNAIHEIDLIAFLTGCDEIIVDKLDLLPTITESKRAGFKEIYRTIYGFEGRCKEFSINCMKDTSVPGIVLISTDTGQYYVVEEKHKLISLTLKNGYELEERPFEILYQSQMTQQVLEDILQKGISRLTGFEESAKLHLQFIHPLIHFFEQNGMEEGICPIT